MATDTCFMECHYSSCEYRIERTVARDQHLSPTKVIRMHEQMIRHVQRRHGSKAAGGSLERLPRPQPREDVDMTRVWRSASALPGSEILRSNDDGYLAFHVDVDVRERVGGAWQCRPPRPSYETPWEILSVADVGVEDAKRLYDERFEFVGPTTHWVEWLGREAIS